MRLRKWLFRLPECGRNGNLRLPVRTMMRQKKEPVNLLENMRNMLSNARKKKKQRNTKNY